MHRHFTKRYDKDKQPVKGNMASAGRTIFKAISLKLLDERWIIQDKLDNYER